MVKILKQAIQQREANNLQEHEKISNVTSKEVQIKTPKEIPQHTH